MCTMPQTMTGSDSSREGAVEEKGSVEGGAHATQIRDETKSHSQWARDN